MGVDAPKPPSHLALAIADRIDEWAFYHRVTVMDVLTALEELRYSLTEAFLKEVEEARGRSDGR
jgi:hypothetical protein